MYFGGEGALRIWPPMELTQQTNWRDLEVLLAVANRAFDTNVILSILSCFGLNRGV